MRQEATMAIWRWRGYRITQRSEGMLYFGAIGFQMAKTAQLRMICILYWTCRTSRH